MELSTHTITDQKFSIVKDVCMCSQEDKESFWLEIKKITETADSQVLTAGQETFEDLNSWSVD